MKRMNGNIFVKLIIPQNIKEFWQGFARLVKSPNTGAWCRSVIHISIKKIYAGGEVCTDHYCVSIMKTKL